MLRETTEINMDNITVGDCMELFEYKNTRVTLAADKMDEMHFT